MIRPQQIKLEDTNVALIGSEADKKARISAAKTEKEWVGAGEKEGVQTWLCADFGVKKWNTPDTFVDGDSFIVLHTYKDKNSGATRYNVHFWLGNESSIDERGVAAYKTVELDDLLNGVPVQYRETQGNESERFLNLFQHFKVLNGGHASAFRRVEQKVFPTRLFQVFQEGKTLKVLQIPQLKTSSLNENDVFILETDQKIYVWRGKDSSPKEAFKAAEVAKKLRDERGAKPKVVNLENEKESEADFWKALEGSRDQVKSSQQYAEEKEAKALKPEQAVLYKLSDASGSLTLEKVQEGDKLDKSGLDTNDVFILDVGKEIYVWIGKGSSIEEKGRAVCYAEGYATSVNKPHALIVRLLEGGESNTFNKYFN
ncbi:gelsolin [Acrasis kona]|uniref:Gelsolin n=1 Tax=Acrasis kona TaxID=1008807 RepID=A0AAW2YTI9_9EUKA